MKFQYIRASVFMLGLAGLGCEDEPSAQQRNDLIQERSVLQSTLDRNTVPVNQQTPEQRNRFDQINRRIQEIDAQAAGQQVEPPLPVPVPVPEPEPVPVPDPVPE